jgi:hypothetical protein
MEDATPEAIEKVIETSNDSVNGSDSTTKAEEPLAPQVNNTGYNNAEHEFDTGFTAWLQVLGSFFLFFNSWYVYTLIVSYHI